MKLLLLLYQNTFFLMCLIFNSMKSALLCTVITLHHADLFSKRNSNHSVIRSVSQKKSISCSSFPVSSCDKKRLWDIKHIICFTIRRMEWKFIWDPIFMITVSWFQIYMVDGNKRLFVTGDGGNHWTTYHLSFELSGDITFQPNSRYSHYLLASSVVVNTKVSYMNENSYYLSG